MPRRGGAGGGTLLPTVAWWCVRPRDATSPTKQEFPAAGEHSITLAVRHEGLRRSAGVRLSPQEPKRTPLSSFHQNVPNVPPTPKRNRRILGYNSDSYPKLNPEIVTDWAL